VFDPEESSCLMSNPSGARDHLLLLLQTAKNRLEYLTRNDWIVGGKPVAQSAGAECSQVGWEFRFSRLSGLISLKGNAQIRFEVIV
jgi:hypothetical protein